MFTFSFGSTIAWASGETYTLNKARTEVDFNDAMTAVKNSGIDVGTNPNTYHVSYSILNTEANRQALLDAAYEYAESCPDSMQKYIDGTGEQTIEKLVNLAETQATQDWKEAIDNSDLAKSLVKQQYEADKADAISILTTVSVSDYSTDKMDPKCTANGHSCTTYQDHVTALLNDAVDDINAFSYNSDTKVYDGSTQIDSYVEAKGVIDKYIGVWDRDYPNQVGNENDGAKTLIKEKGNATTGGQGIYEINEEYLDTTNNSVALSTYLKDSRSDADAIKDATKASLKAEVATVYAKWIVGKTDAQKEYAADMQTALDYLIDHDCNDYTTNAQSYLKSVYYPEDVANLNKNIYDNVGYAVDKAADLAKEAARLGAEKDATGAAVRDADDVADELEKGCIAIYKCARNGNKATVENINSAYNTAVANITALYVSTEDDALAYAKKYAQTKMTDDYADAEDKYYPTEYAAYKTLVDTYVAKIEAATKNSEITYAQNIFNIEKKKIENKDKVDSYTATANLVNAAKSYADALNRNLKNDNKYYTGTTADNDCKIEKDVRKLIGESAARTTAAIDAMSSQALALVTALPTVKAVDDAKDAADDAVDAIPSIVTTASKATIDAAIAAVDAYEELSATEDEYKTKLENAMLKYAYALNNELANKLKATSKTDKEALKALKAEVKAFEDTYEDYTAAVSVLTSGVKKDIQSKLDDIQKTEKDAVKAAIAAIPVKANITEADKATVENARKLYDAYIAEYTDYTYDSSANGFVYGTQKDKDGFVADDFTNYSDLVAAETILGLNDNSDENAKAYVQDLKIVARSVKTSKGVKVTINADVQSLIDEGFTVTYKFYRSTKSNAKFGTAKVTKAENTYLNTAGKKGTKYYYKAKLVVKNAKGEVVATTPLTQCLYASRTF